MNTQVQDSTVGAALVVGGGIGGMQAALDLADAGIKVYLVETKPAIGGVMAQLDKTFPTNDCAMCTMAPRLVELARHKDIEVVTLADVEMVEGHAGDFTVTLMQRPRYVNEDKCTGCGACVLACPMRKVKASNDPKKPQPIPDEYNEGLSYRSAIYIPYPQAVPNVPTIDSEHCLIFHNTKCQACQKACKSGALDFNQKARALTIRVGAIIAAPGYQTIDPSVKPGYGYATHPNVVTALEFERLLSASGPHSGKVLSLRTRANPNASLSFSA